jgi:hypothetical protein
LVTFIACEIVTGSRLTEILGSCPAGFWPAPLAGNPPAWFDKAAGALFKSGNDKQN